MLIQSHVRKHEISNVKRDVDSTNRQLLIDVAVEAAKISFTEKQRSRHIVSSVRFDSQSKRAVRGVGAGIVILAVFTVYQDRQPVRHVSSTSSVRPC